MNATPHTTLGYTSLKLIGVNPLGCLVAIGTHFLADYIGERGLYTDKQRIIYDVLPTLIAFVFAYFFGGENEVWLLLLGSVLGNLPDLIDKKLYLSIFLPKKFKSTEYLHWQKVIINPTPKQTRLIGYLAMILILIQV
jgi:hypothetical protein